MGWVDGGVVVVDGRSCMVIEYAEDFDINASGLWSL